MCLCRLCFLSVFAALNPRPSFPSVPHYPVCPKRQKCSRPLWLWAGKGCHLSLSLQPVCSSQPSNCNHSGPFLAHLLRRNTIQTESVGTLICSACIVPSNWLLYMRRNLHAAKRFTPVFIIVILWCLL